MTRTLRARLLGGAALALIAAPGLAAELTVAMQLEPPALDPTAGAAAAIDEVVYPNLFEGLVWSTPSGEIVPKLAKSWETSEDGTVWTFHLQEGVKFHDGADFDASDVKFSLDRINAEGSQNAQKGKFSGIASVEVVDPLTVKVTLNEPQGFFLNNLANGDAVMLDPASVETNGTAPVGTGPFKFGDRAEGASITLVKNDAYWGAAPAMDSVTWRFISDPTAALNALMAGDVDGFVGYPSPETVPQFEADPRFTVNTRTTEGETILSTNTRKPPFNDLKVRQAIAHALDKQAIIDGAMFGMGVPIGSHFAPHHPAYVDLTGTYPHDIAAAKKLLAEAGFPDGFKATLKLPPPSYARRGGEIVAAQLREIGIELEIQNVEWGQWLEQAFKGKDYDLTIVSHTEPMDIGIYANPDYYFQYDNPELQALMKKINATIDPGVRNALLAKAQQIVAEDAVNGFLFQLEIADIWPAKLEGWPTGATVQSLNLTEAKWK
ncbi:ABC transporter substrate-binding protein [Rhodovulum sp. DZ06]|uniref:ABC transporter substrate-binding protein n=1 Tax=Rhodovulum sp. DZ06 TaxID=3425126 RepID=UPI003D324AD0